MFRQLALDTRRRCRRDVRAWCLASACTSCRKPRRCASRKRWHRLAPMTPDPSAVALLREYRYIVQCHGDDRDSKLAEIDAVLASLAGRPQEMCSTCHGRGWIMKSNHQHLQGVSMGASWNEPCPDCGPLAGRDTPLLCWWCKNPDAKPLVCNDEQTLAMCGNCADRIAKFMAPRPAGDPPAAPPPPPDCCTCGHSERDHQDRDEGTHECRRCNCVQFAFAKPVSDLAAQIRALPRYKYSEEFDGHIEELTGRFLKYADVLRLVTGEKP